MRVLEGVPGATLLARGGYYQSPEAMPSMGFLTRGSDGAKYGTGLRDWHEHGAKSSTRSFLRVRTQKTSAHVLSLRPGVQAASAPPWRTGSGSANSSLAQG
jgi:hypothetical protein